MYAWIRYPSQAYLVQAHATAWTATAVRIWFFKPKIKIHREGWVWRSAVTPAGPDDGIDFGLLSALLGEFALPECRGCAGIGVGDVVLQFGPLNAPLPPVISSSIHCASFLRIDGLTVDPQLPSSERGTYGPVLGLNVTGSGCNGVVDTGSWPDSSPTTLNESESVLKRRLFRII